MLKLLNIKKDYVVGDAKVRALKGVSLEFRRSEFVCILGQSGCGKTTLLNIIGGLDQYTSGNLIIKGKSTKDFTDRDWDVYRNHKIGFIFQSYNLISHQTVLGNVEIALTIAGIGKEERRKRAAQALERVGLKGQLNKYPNQLSGGQMQRVAIARALVNNPDILLADEPTGALDSATSVQIMDLIREIAGERLVIMVTHNPELAEQYASRIVRLKDGRVESDSNPFDSSVEAEPPLRRPRRKPAKKGKKERASMSFGASLALSFRNLMTKKGRTAVTSVAGSIGIISVCLVLALSNGFNSYIQSMEEDMLSYYPLKVSEQSMDITSIMSGFRSSKDMPDLSKLDDKVYVNSFLTGIAKGMTVTNNISEEYIDYVEGLSDEDCFAIQYSYGATLSDNLFTSVVTGATVEEQTTRILSLDNLKAFYIQELNAKATQYAELAYLVNYLGSVVSKMPGTADFTDERYGEYVLSQYDIVKGEFPKSSDEAVLVIGSNNDVTDLTLAQLGFIDEVTFLSLFDLGDEDKTEGVDDYKTISFDDILSKEFVLYNNDAVYTKNESAGPLDYAFQYKGEKSALEVGENEGTKIRVSGILRLKDDLTYGCLSNGLNLTEKLVEDYIQANKQSKIATWLTTEGCFDYQYEGKPIKLYRSPCETLNASYSKIEYEHPLVGPLTFYVSYSEGAALRTVSANDMPNSIAIYATSFDGKDHITSYLDEWNETHEDNDKVTYIDTVGTLMGMVQTILNAITYVLVAFTAISLVVSSVMIGIITYVSVVERVKEIGVLRSLGARKQDIRNLFNAETFIIGLSAGVFGVLVTYILSFFVNLILGALTGIATLCSLPFLSAVIMVLISVVLTLISGLIPASAAAKKDPVIALRTE